jgi:hypothetical protein
MQKERKEVCHHNHIILKNIINKKINWADLVVGAEIKKRYTRYLSITLFNRRF